MLKKLTLAALLTGALALSNSAAAMVDRTLCVFDVVGANGDTYQMMKQYVLAAQQWGVNFELKPYTCLLYTSPSPRDKRQSRMPSSA